MDTIAFHGTNNLGFAQVGDYYVGSNGFPFSLHLGNGSLTTFLSGSQDANANGINDNNLVVGDFFDGTTEHGFLIKPTGAKILDDPAAGSIGTFAKGINNNGQIVGGYFDSNGLEHGFVRGIGGKWTTLDDSLGINTECEGINNKGQIVGLYFANGVEHGFVAANVNGKYVFTEIDDPLGVKGTAAFGINNHGEIVGIYYDASGHEHGFHT